MEDQILDDMQQGELLLTEAGQSHSRAAGKWATFLAILGFLFVGLYVIALILTLLKAFSFITFLLTSVSLLIFFIPIWLLYQFGSKTKLAITTNNANALTESFKAEKNYFLFFSILTLLWIAAAVISVLFLANMGLQSAF